MRARRWGAAAAAAALPALAIPIHDPDLWWHLSAGRWIVDNLALPRADWLSRTLAGAAWTDFEWLAQVLFYAVHAAAGVPGLWALKTAMLGAGAWAAGALARRLGASVWAAALAAALWAAALLPRADARTELFSLLLFSALLRALETRRRRLADRSQALLDPWWAAAFFSLWACLHAGFALGLALLAAYAAEERRRSRRSRLWRTALAAAAGTFVNPYGWEVHAVALRHALERGSLAVIDEWKALDPAPEHWPAWLLLAAAAWALRDKRRFEGGLGLALGAAAALHVRFIPYLACALPLLLPPALGRRAAAGGLAALAMLSAYNGRRAGFPRGTFSGRLLCVEAADFLERHPDLAALPAYHPAGWGGYLGWRLGLRVFQDGRYLFHPLLARAASSARDPGSWAKFLEDGASDLVLIENVPLMLPSTRTYPDGSTRVFERPFYVEYMPRARWALVHFDREALVFVRRSALTARRLAELEYRWLRPRDEAALEDARSRGEVDEAAFARERLRRAS